MFPRTSNRKAISVVLTTMIILVASVVLGTGVVIYGTSLFQTGAQQEEISIQGLRVWVNATDTNGISWGAVGVRNSGDKIISVDNILIRGASVPFTQWFVDKNQTAVDINNFQSQYMMTSMLTASNLLLNSTAYNSLCTSTTTVTNLMIDFDGVATASKPTLCLAQASGPTALNPGERGIIYFRAPTGLLTAVDSGSSINVSVFAGKTGAPTSVTVGTS